MTSSYFSSHHNHDDNDNESNNNNNNQRNYNDSSSQPLTTCHPELLMQKLNSFSSNISRHRMSKKKLSLATTTTTTSITSTTKKNKKRGEQQLHVPTTKAIDDALIGACTSLLYFIRDETQKLSSSSSSSSSSPATTTTALELVTLDDENCDRDGNGDATVSIESIREMLEMVMVQSIRASSEVGDFVLLPKLVYAVVEYATAFAATVTTATVATDVDAANVNNNGSTALLSPRIFGEAIASLSKTKASLSKIKSLWNYFVHDAVVVAATRKNNGILTSPPSAYELNAMLSSLRERGKVSAAMKVYRRVTTTATAVDVAVVATAVDDDDAVLPKEDGLGMIKGDAYTASILFGMLSDSISSNRGGGGRIWNDPPPEMMIASSSTAQSNLSPCWQWNEAMALLDAFAPCQLNNYAYAALLKVNERATEEYNNSDSKTTLRRHDGVRCAMSVLERMKKDKISPDVVTCSTLVTTFDKGRNWKAAVTLLNAMRASYTSPSSGTAVNIDGEKKWSLPLPNAFTYSLVIAACARSNQGEMALSLLHQMTEMVSPPFEGGNCNDGDVVGNAVWVYNAALLACAELSSSADAAPSFGTRSSKPNNKGTHLATAFDILAKMEHDGSVEDGGGASVSPDTVSYNTVLSVLDDSSFAAVKESQADKTKRGSSRLARHADISDVVMDVLDSMEARGVPRDAVTYYNAILACRSRSEDALAILRRSLSDSDFMQMVSSSNELDGAQLKGRAATGVVFVANAALSVAAASGDVYAASEVLSMLSAANSKLNAESIKHIIRTLGKINDCEAILAVLICLKGQSSANDILKERYSIDILSNLSEKSIPMVEEEIYSAAITSCLRHDELGTANHILLSMKRNGLTPNQRSLKEIIAEYCRMAMNTSKEEFKLARQAKRQATVGSGGSLRHNGLVEPIYITSRARAKAALIMLKSVDSPPPSLLSPVAKACCSAGLWQDARSILRRMHRAAICELRQRGTGSVGGSATFLGELPRLHRSLLKFCAKGGNITPALNFADDIQFLASQIRMHGKSLRGNTGNSEEKEPGLITLSSRLLMDIPTPESIPEAVFSDAGALSTVLDRPIGLTGQDWKLLLIAASRGGHWKVCLGTLPFIRPYVKETHPMYARESSMSSISGVGPSRPSLERLNRKYERIARALTAAILCFEVRGQYAWAMRAIDDWIEWSGRRPRKEAVASACRALAKRYRGQEVLTMVTKVVNIPAVSESDGLDDDLEVSDYTYEKAVYTESINALHKSGLYEEADQLYAAGVSNGHLPWAVVQSVTDKKRLRLDLHGMSAAVAHSAVRVSLQKEIMESSSQSSPDDNIAWDRDVMIITGRGRRSGERFRPVLRPEVQRMLTEEFYPPLGSTSIPGNMGAILVPGKDIEAWLRHQRQQKGERLLFVADVIRDLSSGNRLEKALRSSGNRLEKALIRKIEAERTTGAAENDDKDQ